MRIAVIGYGRQGRSAVKYWRKGNDITVCDQNTEITVPEGVEVQLGENYLDDLDRFHLIIRSPRVHPNDIAKANGERILRKVTTATEEFMRVCPAPIIGVTGTKGKGTTSSLIAAILEAAGHKVHLGGNIGISPLEMISWDIQPAHWVVLELANFQLIDLGVSPDVAVCLMIVPEHLDWHSDMTEYIHSKQNLFKHQSSNDLAVFNRQNDYSGIIAGVSPALKISYEVPEKGHDPVEKRGAYVKGDDIYMNSDRVCSIEDVRLLGWHNLQNICAAIAATWKIINKDSAAIKTAVRNFTGLPHRLEKVLTLTRGAHAGVTFYNDSFSTTPHSAQAAMLAIPGNKVVICGGVDRNLDLSGIAKTALKTSAGVKHMILIGQTGPKIARELELVGFKNFTLLRATTIEVGDKIAEEIVAVAAEKSNQGDAIVFSPGCASFDMFKDFEVRGDLFRTAVENLAKVVNTDSGLHE